MGQVHVAPGIDQFLLLTFVAFHVAVSLHTQKRASNNPPKSREHKQWLQDSEDPGVLPRTVELIFKVTGKLF